MDGVVTDAVAACWGFERAEVFALGVLGTMEGSEQQKSRVLYSKNE